MLVKVLTNGGAKLGLVLVVTADTKGRALYVVELPTGEVLVHPAEGIQVHTAEDV